MILLAASHSSSISPMIYSGLVSAVISATVAILGNALMAFIQFKNNQKTINTQKENARMDRQTNLLYKNRVDQFGALQNAIAELVVNFADANEILENIRQEKKANSQISPQATSFEFYQHGAKAEELQKKSDETIDKLHKGISLVRLYLYEDSDENKSLLDDLYAMLNSLEKNGKVTSVRLDAFIDKARRYLANQMEQLSDKIK